MLSNSSFVLKQISPPQNQSSASILCQIQQKSHFPSTPYIKWTKQEDVLYVRFLKANVQRMKKTHFRKPYNKFKKMSEYVTSKDSFQCRSHHQKMMKKFNSVQKIIEHLSSFLQKYHKTEGPKTQNKQINQNREVTAKKTKSQLEQNNNNILISQIKIENLNIEIKDLYQPKEITPAASNSTITRTHSDAYLGKHSQENLIVQKQFPQEKNPYPTQLKTEPYNNLYESQFSFKNFHQVKPQPLETASFSQSRDFNILQNHQLNWNMNTSYRNEAWLQWENYFRHQQYINWCMYNMPPTNSLSSPTNQLGQKINPSQYQFIKTEEKTNQ